jgi:hypothetical protein
MKRYFIFILTALISAVSLSQTINTPEVFSFKQEVFRPVSYYTGQADISVPLCQIQTNEMTIPISLAYIGGEGLRPVNPYSSVGFGWRLTAGGVITRTVKNIPDEYVSLTGPLNGFFSLLSSSSLISNESVRNNASSLMSYLSNGDAYFNSSYEYSPDIFTFNFLGYTGSFVMGYDKKFHVQSKDIFDIQMLGGPYAVSGGFHFVMTANNGVKYTFGYCNSNASSTAAIELSGTATSSLSSSQMNAWYLNSIKFPSGKEISFNYDTPISSGFNYRFIFRYPTVNGSGTSGALVSPVVLKNIVFDGDTVSVSSSSVHQGRYGDNVARINSISVKNKDNQTIRQISLKYKIKNGSIYPQYYILDSLKVDAEKYAFNYNKLDSLPIPTDDLNGKFFGSDYWGYYNGQPVLVGISGAQADNYMNQISPLTQKLSSATNSKIGILTSIKYPTGDTRTFMYEANDYAAVGLIDSQGYSIHNGNSQSTPCGGLRIAQITMGNQTKQYKYLSSPHPENPPYISSGILHRAPSISYYNGQISNELSVDGEAPITYSQVVEYNQDNSHIIYQMNSALDFPDQSNVSSTGFYNAWSKNSALFNCFSPQTLISALGTRSSCSIERGQIGSILIYDSSNNLKKKTTYSYNHDSNRYSQYVAGINLINTANPNIASVAIYLMNACGLSSVPFFSMLHSYCTYTFPVLLTKEETTDYYPTSSVTRTIRYNYNNQLLQSCVTTYNSRGDSVKVQYRYPADINTGTYALMTNLNMLNFPIEQTTLKNNSITGSKLTTYKSNSSSYVSDKSYSLEITSPLSSFSYYNGSAMDSHYGNTADISYDIYSTHNNVKQVTGRDGTSTSYLWDATDTYPMSKAKGATFSQISSLDGKDAAYASNTSWSALNGLVPSFLVSTYSYKPLVGLVTATDPRGVTANYTYDTFNRLFLARNDDKNILSRYSYGYHNAPDNGQGGYSAPTALITPGATSYTPGAAGSASLGAVSGGSGNYTYNWYLKNSSGTVLASNENSTSTSFSYTCSQTGTLTVQCRIVDNQTGLVYTASVSITVNTVSVPGTITMNSGYVCTAYTLTNMGTSAGGFFVFYPTATMTIYQGYAVGKVSSNCKPSSTRNYTCSNGGRTWYVIINTTGDIVITLAGGTTLPAYSTAVINFSYNL